MGSYVVRGPICVVTSSHHQGALSYWFLWGLMGWGSYGRWHICPPVAPHPDPPCSSPPGIPFLSGAQRWCPHPNPPIPTPPPLWVLMRSYGVVGPIGVVMSSRHQGALSHGILWGLMG